ncbi:major facilitator superfamily domain-containing protein [Leptodontidium sp. MPI-SDFR-AT-0119]|nr:major facilitator superfamily domain-containing protein [Leptodontidium sp. MPI-SDFR-AT-0119]
MEERIEIAPALDEVIHSPHHWHTLGHVRLRDAETNKIILLPPPSLDPNDPLRWRVSLFPSLAKSRKSLLTDNDSRSKAYKIWIAILVSTAMVMCNFMAAGPTIAMVSVAKSYFPDESPDVSIPKVAYFFNNSALAQGVGNIIWVPITIKYGRRPVYIFAFVVYFFMIIGSGAATTYAGEIVTRLFLGLAGGAGECLAPLTITDIFFLHERGLYMAIYNAALSTGVAFGSVISGLITINHGWRVIYWVGAALVGSTLLCVVFFFPETAYERLNHNLTADPAALHTEKAPIGGGSHSEDHEAGITNIPRKMSYLKTLRLWDGRRYTDESLWKMIIRPIGLITLPPVFWATIVMSVTIGFLVAISSNIASAMQSAYGFKAYQAGLCYIAAILGSLLGILLGGPFSDWVADYFTRRNGGIREPEMRLPAIMLAVVASPLALLLYGFGIQNQMHWVVPTMGLFFISFAVTQGTNVSFTYCIDSYRPIAGEVTVTQLAFKSCFGFLLSFYTNVWVEKGYGLAYGEMAAISGGCLLLWIPLFIWGRSIRRSSLKWRVVSFISWADDREVGE